MKWVRASLFAKRWIAFGRAGFVGKRSPKPRKGGVVWWADWMFGLGARRYIERTHRLGGEENVS